MSISARLHVPFLICLSAEFHKDNLENMFLICVFVSYVCEREISKYVIHCYNYISIFWLFFKSRDFDIWWNIRGDSPQNSSSVSQLLVFFFG